jgi:uncharacterized DUF497 family protein
MSNIIFTWSQEKNLYNFKEHGIWFEEAKTVFFDDEALLLSDPEHSGEEDRFLMLGFSSATRIMIVSHCYRSNDDEIRIISARKASLKERNQYLQRKKS